MWVLAVWLAAGCSVAVKFHHLEILLWPRPQATTQDPDTRAQPWHALRHTHCTMQSCNREKKRIGRLTHTVVPPTVKPRTQKVVSQSRGSCQGPDLSGNSTVVAMLHLVSVRVPLLLHQNNLLQQTPGAYNGSNAYPTAFLLHVCVCVFLCLLRVLTNAPQVVVYVSVSRHSSKSGCAQPSIIAQN